MALENIIDTVFGCGLTVEDLRHIRWGEVVARMCRRLVHAAKEIGTLPAVHARVFPWILEIKRQITTKAQCRLVFINDS